MINVNVNTGVNAYMNTLTSKDMNIDTPNIKEALGSPNQASPDDVHSLASNSHDFSGSSPTTPPRPRLRI